jgi:alpha-galactosidase
MKLISEFVYENGKRMKIQSTVLKGLVLLGFVITSGAEAQTSTSIHFDAQTKIFRIDAAGITYAFGVNAQDQLQSIYWGAQIGKRGPDPPSDGKGGRRLL